MGISNRDALEGASFQGIRSDRGQGTIEYLLILIVMVSIILAGVWQFNSAFKVWANNYFGNYLSCLLETGELPTIGGTPGDSGICNEQFEGFSLAKGFPQKPQSGTSASASGPKRRSGVTSEARSGSGGRGGSGTGSSGRVGRWSPTIGANNPKNSSSKGKNSNTDNGTNTGSTAISSTSAGYRTEYGPRGERLTVLDNSSTLDEKEAQKNKRTKVTAGPPSGAEARTKVRMPAAQKPPPTNADSGDGSGFNFTNFLRYLLIAGIIIAIVIFLGGQILAMSKASE